MTEYISREYALSCVDDFLSKTGMPIAAQFFYDCFRECEAANVQPVKHGTWSEDEQGYDVYVECSECGLNLSTSNYIENEWREILKYCPCCGAKMDGDSE